MCRLRRRNFPLRGRGHPTVKLRPANVARRGRRCDAMKLHRIATCRAERSLWHKNFHPVSLTNLCLSVIPDMSK